MQTTLILPEIETSRQSKFNYRFKNETPQYQIINDFSSVGTSPNFTN